MFNRLIKSQFAANIASIAVSWYLRLVHATCRISIVDRTHFDDALALGNGVIIVFWHGRLMMAPSLCKHTERPIYMLVSANRDGEIITQACRSFDIQFIRGSAANPKKRTRNKNGAAATTQMIAALETGSIVGFTPDGPRGPGEKVQAGVIRLAQMTGAPIVPCGLAGGGGRTLASWDRFFLIAPFAKIAATSGPALSVPKEIGDEDIEKLRISLENSLAAATADAEAVVRKTRPGVVPR